MAVDAARAEASLAYLVSNARDGDLEKAYREAREAEHMLKYEEALLIKGMDNDKVPATLRTAYARATDRWKERADREAIKYAALKVVEARRDAEKMTIMLYQTQVRDRL